MEEKIRFALLSFFTAAVVSPEGPQITTVARVRHHIVTHVQDWANVRPAAPHAGNGRGHHESRIRCSSQ
jgi:hypothetical protein